MTLTILGKDDPSEDQETEAELFDEICRLMQATSEEARDRVGKWIDRIAANLQLYKAEAEKDSPKVSVTRNHLDKEIKKLSKDIANYDSQPPYLFYSSATDNRFDNPVNRRRREEEHEAEHREYRAALQKRLTHLLKCRENPSWKSARGTIQTMKEGTLESNFAADIVFMFKKFRPNSGSSKEDGDLHVVGEKTFKLITGEDVSFNLEHFLKKALRQSNDAKRAS